jgi:hypothetical protein
LKDLVPYCNNTINIHQENTVKLIIIKLKKGNKGGKTTLAAYLCFFSALMEEDIIYAITYACEWKPQPMI